MRLTLENIGKSFDDKVILSDFSYTFPERGLCVISGESGVGKTTLLRIICGFDKNYCGAVKNGGFSNVSICFQEYRLIPTITSLQNLTEISFAKATENDVHRARELLFRLNFTENDLTLYPSELSGGMKQRVSFARAILKPAPILILDEPTKEVDSAISKIMLDIIAEEVKKRLVLLVTHNMHDLDALKYEKIELGTRS